MNVPALISVGLFSTATAYAAMAAVIIWLLPLSLRAKLIAALFYVSSSLSAIGVAFGILLGGMGPFGLSTGNWAVVFVIAQNVLWVFIANAIFEIVSEIRSR